MAQIARDAMDVRCLGTVGGVIGAVIGFLAFAWIGTWLGGAALLLVIPGIPFGWWIGVRAALGLIAR